MFTDLFKPMKAPSTSVNLATLTYPRFASYKLDGIRGTVQNGKLYSNSMKLIPNLYAQKLFGNAVLNGLDGELIVGPPNAPDSCRRTMSALMAKDGEPIELAFYVFDHLAMPPSRTCIQFAEPYECRLERLNKFFSGRNTQVFIHILPQVRIRNEEQLLMMEAEALTQGYEGLMVRSVDGIYKPGPNRCTPKEGIIFKLKRFVDAEAVITGFEEAMENHNEAKVNELGRSKRSTHKAGLKPAGMVGTILATDCKTKQAIRIGPGKMTHKERVHFFQYPEDGIGKTCTYKHFPSGGKDLPRHPTYKCLRDPRDISKK